MNFLITGGCGYIGTQLTKHLLSKRNKVTVVDSCWFGNFHKKNKMLKIIKKDIRNFEDLNIKGIDSFHDRTSQTLNTYFIIVCITLLVLSDYMSTWFIKFLNNHLRN